MEAMRVYEVEGSRRRRWTIGTFGMAETVSRRRVGILGLNYGIGQEDRVRLVCAGCWSEPCRIGAYCDLGIMVRRRRGRRKLSQCWPVVGYKSEREVRSVKARG